MRSGIFEALEGHVLQFAHNPTMLASNPPAKDTVERIGSLLRDDLLTAGQVPRVGSMSSMNDRHGGTFGRHR